MNKHRPASCRCALVKLIVRMRIRFLAPFPWYPNRRTIHKTASCSKLEKKLLKARVPLLVLVIPLVSPQLVLLDSNVREEEHRLLLKPQQNGNNEKDETVLLKPGWTFLIQTTQLSKGISYSYELKIAHSPRSYGHLKLTKTLRFIT